MRTSTRFLNLLLVLIAVLCSWSICVGASTREVWSELTRCLQAGKAEREQEAARLGVILPSQMPSAYDQPQTQQKAEPSFPPRFEEITKHEAEGTVSCQANVNSHDLPTASPDEKPTFMTVAPRTSEPMPKRAPSPVSSEHQKAIATAKVLGVSEDRELGEFLAYFPAVEDSSETPPPSAPSKPVYTPQVTLGSVVEVDSEKTETPVASTVVSRPAAEPAAPKEVVGMTAPKLVDQKGNSDKLINRAADAAHPHRVAFEKLLDKMESRRAWRKKQAQKHAIVLPSERAATQATSTNSVGANTVSTSERLKQHLEKLSARRELREREAAKFGVDLPSKHLAGSGVVAQTAPVHPDSTVCRPMPMHRSNPVESPLN